ncbi:GIY-YIG nuclease family protein [Gracilimonas sp. BCB1]|uniref:GIY-YIG nuclease family protein n=1 Tax=Gracilimonas sp. BCB1 TaxID=3152362 RepID=UPI003F831FCB
MSFYAYMIKSESNGKHYYGHTSDINERLKSHNSTQNKYTRGKGPWVLIGYVQTESKASAMKLENKLKKMKSPKRALAWIERHGSAR